MDYSQGECLFISMIDRDGDKYFCKRKAFELFVHQHQTRIPGASYSRCIDVSENDLRSRGHFPQKKQKLGPENCSCSPNGFCLGCEGDYKDAIEFKNRDKHVSDTVTSTAVGNESPQYQDSEMSKSESRGSRSIASSELSSRTTVSSRSSSLERDDQTGGVSLYPRELSIEQQIEHMSHHIIPSIPLCDIQFLDSHESLDRGHQPMDQSHFIKYDGERPSITSLEQLRLASSKMDFNRHPNDRDEIDRSTTSSSGTTPTPSRASQDDGSSIMDLDDPSTEGDKSSQSKSSSETSELIEKETASSRSSKLERLIKDVVLRSSPPEVAEYLYQAVKGRLECASVDDLRQQESNGDLSLLELLELQALTSAALSSDSSSKWDSSSTPDKGEKSGTLPTIVECSPSSTTTPSGINSASDGAQSGDASSSIGQAGRGDSAAPKHNDKTSDPQSKSQNGNVKISSNSNQQLQLRCPFNAMAPAIFCANPETGQKYRVCAGPGWNNVQHLKGHLKSHHMKEEPRSNALQCSRCQNDFLNQDDLRTHDENVDCPITCPICASVFATKEMRQQHRKQVHQEDLRETIYMEISQATWKTVNDNLKLYTDALKKGKGKEPIKPALERWVEANRARFEVGRNSKARANAKLELGQWYIIFTTLRRQNIIPDHPFYDHVISHGDLAEEKILFISDALMAARIKANMLPPPEIREIEDDGERANRAYDAYFRDLFRDTVRVAAATKFSDNVDGMFGSQDESTDQRTNDSPALDYNLPNTMPAPGQRFEFGDALPNTSRPSPNFFTGAQDHDAGMSIPNTNMTNPSSIEDDSWLDQFSEEQLLNFDQELQTGFAPPNMGQASSFSGSSSYPEDWTRHTGAG